MRTPADTRRSIASETAEATRTKQTPKHLAGQLCYASLNMVGRSLLGVQMPFSSSCIGSNCIPLQNECEAHPSVTTLVGQVEKLISCLSLIP